MHARSHLAQAIFAQDIHLAQEMHFQEWACLWIRGIVPLSLVKDVVDKYPPSSVLCSVTSATSSAPVEISGKITIYGDASGGAFTKSPLLRRIGVGLACIDQEAN